ncbi:MAG: hypothetical protein ACOX0A_01465 [Thermoguttaceae bacterium]|jgi:cation transport ATPase
MTKRKLYFPGIGGNRYEVSLDELRDQAYKGKIKREDPLILVETKNGKTSERVIPCRKIKGIKAVFAEGEAERRQEEVLRELEKTAERVEKQRIHDEKSAKKQRREEEKSAKKRRRREEKQRLREETKRTLRDQEEIRLESTAQYPLIRSRMIVRFVTIWPTVICTIVAFFAFILYNVSASLRSEGFDLPIFLQSAGALLLFLGALSVLSFIGYWLLTAAICLVQYQMETLQEVLEEQSERNIAALAQLTEAVRALESPKRSDTE